ncbi:hypothetical protein L1987_44634 [Smallanthus sonchifolius]|uniref:Uncharacterized protein n=1 Tax=Smallanthus sonchifolius TaxID=185202 RepID=A0ACB9GR11_9ASTR|nr:hypothetical protein L1987_44634 [Smallanthus sonchifolius]
MGGGDSFSAGGPGKGVYSRLSDLRVLNEYPEIPSFFSIQLHLQRYGQCTGFTLHLADVESAFGGDALEKSCI